MTQTPTFDIGRNMGGGVSLPPDETYSAGADTDGGWVDASALEGPVQAVCSVGAVSGGPSAQKINFVMDEADDSAGLNVQEVVSQEEVNLTADDKFGIINAKTTKPFVRVVVDDAGSSFTDGTTPSIEVCAVVLGQKQRV